MRIVLALMSIALLGCAEKPGSETAPKPVADANYRPISTLGEFNDIVVGKTLTFEDVNTFTVRADGTLDGDFQGPLAGTWRWEDGYWCRILTTPARPEDCQLWETNGTALRATRAKGTGPSFQYTF